MLSTLFRSSQRVSVGRPPAAYGRHHDSAVGKRTPAWQRCQWNDGGRCRDYWCMGAGCCGRGAIPHACSVVEMLACPRGDSRSASHRSEMEIPHRGGSSVTGAAMRQRAAVIG